MSNRFLSTDTTGNVTDGSLDLYGNTIGAVNLTGALPIKSDSSGVLNAQLLDIADVKGLQTALNATISNPLTSNLNCDQKTILDCKSIDIKTGTNTATLVYNGGSDISLDVNLLGADVSYAGGATTVGQLAVFDSTDGKIIKDGLKNVDQVCLTSGFNMEANIDMKGNNIVMGSGLVDGVDVSTLPGDISAKLPLAGGNMSGAIDMKINEIKTISRLTMDTGSYILAPNAARINLYGSDNNISFFAGTDYCSSRSPLLHADGLVGAPSIAFEQFLTDGFYHDVSNGIVHYSSQGVKKASLTTTGIATDNISELTSANGVVIDGLTVKDSSIYTGTYMSGTSIVKSRSASADINLLSTYVDASAIGIGAFMSGVSGGLYISRCDNNGNFGGINLLNIQHSGDISLVQAGKAFSSDVIKTDTIQGKSNTTLSIGATTNTSVSLGASAIATNVQGNLNMVSGKILTTNTINEVTAGAGINIDDVLIRDGEVRPSSCNLGLHASSVSKLSVWQNGITNVMSWTTGLTECFTPMAIDTIRGYSGGALSIGASTNNAVNIGASGIDTTVSGNLVYAQAHVQCYGGVWNANTVANTPMTNATNLTNINTNYLINFGTDIKSDMAVGFSFTTAGRITYTATKTRMVHTAYSLSGTDTKNGICSIAVFKNGAVLQGSVAYIDMTGGASSTAIHIAAMASTNDYFELYARSSVASNVLTIAYVNMFQMVMLN